ESATRILNMVLTKKVDKTPYELWSERTHRAPNRLCLNVEAEEHSLGDLNEPTSHKAAMLDPESNKWLDPMNERMQSMIDNMVWVLVDLPPNCKTVVSFVDPKHPRKYASFKDPFMVLSKHQEAGIKDLMRKSKGFVDPKHPKKYASFKDPFMVLSKHQEAGIKDLMRKSKERLNLNKTQGASTPEEVKRMQNVPYASSVGSIINPKAELRVDCHCYAGFETDRDDTKSQTGYVFVLNGGAVDWKSSKQILPQCLLQKLNILLLRSCNGSCLD
nr:hypothetical protein [Tanacetum cinerariifolium]